MVLWYLLLLLGLGCGPATPTSGQSPAQPFAAGVSVPELPDSSELPEVVLRPSERQFESDIRRFEALEKETPSPSGSVLFLGSSSIRKWNSLEQDMAGIRVVNRGFGGAIIRQVSAYAPRIAYPLAPSLIVLYCGENDIANDSLGAEVPLTDLQDFVALVRFHLPETPVLFLSMKPSPARWKYWDKFREGNRLIREWAATQDDVSYLDVGQVMLLPSGEVDPSIFVRDRLHLNAAGYARWTELIRPVVRSLLEEP